MDEELLLRTQKNKHSVCLIMSNKKKKNGLGIGILMVLEIIDNYNFLKYRTRNNLQDNQKYHNIIINSNLIGLEHSIY